MNRKIISFLLLPFVLQVINCGKSVTEPEEEPEPCEGICGEAILEGYDFHQGIRVRILETNDVTDTDEKGNFELPLPNDGGYSIIAAYAFFISDTVFIEVKDSTVVDSLQMSLVQYLKPKMVPDTTVFSIDSTLGFTIEIMNLLDREVCGPERIREDQLWLRDIQDTTKIFKLFVATRDLPRAIAYEPFETKILRFEVSANAFNAPAGTYRAWLADKFGPTLSTPLCFMGRNDSTFGKSFGPAKGWVTIKIE